MLWIINFFYSTFYRLSRIIMMLHILICFFLPQIPFSPLFMKNYQQPKVAHSMYFPRFLCRHHIWRSLDPPLHIWSFFMKKTDNGFNFFFASFFYWERRNFFHLHLFSLFYKDATLFHWPTPGYPSGFIWCFPIWLSTFIKLSDGDLQCEFIQNFKTRFGAPSCIFIAFFLVGLAPSLSVALLAIVLGLLLLIIDGRGRRLTSSQNSPALLRRCSNIHLHTYLKAFS